MSDVDANADLAARILDAVRKVDRDAEVEVTVNTGTLGLTRFANSMIHQNFTETSTTALLRLHSGGRTCSVNGILPSSDPESAARRAEAITALADRAAAAVKLLPEDTGWPGLSEPAAGSRAVPSHGYDEETATAGPGARAAAVRAYVDALEDLTAAGVCQTGASVTTYANTAGNQLSGRLSSATIDAIARARVGRPAGADPSAREYADGLARGSAVRLSSLDPAALGRVAAAKARAGVTTIDLEPGRYPVILEPNCVAQILQFLGVYGFNGLAVNQKRSFVDIGAQQFDPRITLVEDATAEDAIGLPFDGDGTLRHRLPLVENGITRSSVHSRRTAAEAGTTSTGHALAGGDTIGALPLNIAMEPGDGGSLTDLIGNVERGLLVTDLWYVRVLDPRTLVSTGLTRNGLWLIEDGQIGPAVSNLRFTQSYVDALGPGAVLGVGSSTEMLSPVGFSTSIVATNSVPALHLASWSFTGGANG